MQLMQPYVQKSSRTILPRSASSESGAGTLYHSRPAGNSGAWMRTGASLTERRRLGR